MGVSTNRARGAGGHRRDDCDGSHAGLRAGRGPQATPHAARHRARAAGTNRTDGRKERNERLRPRLPTRSSRRFTNTSGPLAAAGLWRGVVAVGPGSSPVSTLPWNRPHHLVCEPLCSCARRAPRASSADPPEDDPSSRAISARSRPGSRSLGRNAILRWLCASLRGRTARARREPRKRARGERP